ncbi:arylsulfatase [Pontibacter sp. G13]|uniref:arylsulfatase n=1 Tax=Pontibacter sp. G13 TaxID=3074898 RepID=UPI00288A13F0|nr:arylsulfatase [Pontibacter sp. G13]WNJ20587.1 arylsulfatase [Pontibacter sp. G13]
MRKHQLYWIMIGLCAVWAGCQTNASSSVDLQDSPSGPNIVYILVDDMGYADLGVYGQETIPTPNLDRMAGEGIRFMQHYAGSTVCAPSRGALMTGRHSGHGRVRGNYERGSHGFGGGLHLQPQDVTVAEVLSRGGYSTGLIGKWGLGMHGTTGEPTSKGFDSYFGFLNQAHAHWQFPEYLFRDGDTVEIAENQNGQRGAYSNDLFTDGAIDFISEHQENPFFLYLAYTTPHAEMIVPEDSIFEQYKGQFEETPFVENTQGGNKKGFGRYQSQPNPKAAYATMVHRIDLDVQRILDHLQELGLDEQTIVMFSSDNGPHREGGAHPDQFDSNGPLRGMKRDLYEGGIRIPFIARWPGHIPAGQSSDHISAFWDVLPTVAELAHVDISNLEIDGISFAPEMLGKGDLQEKHDYLYWEFHEAKYTHQAIRRGDWKAVRLNPSKPVELYNLSTDLSESRNVADQYPDLAAELAILMDQSRTPHEIWKVKQPQISAAQAD